MFCGAHFCFCFCFTGGWTRFGPRTGRLVVVVVVERFGAEHGAGLLVMGMRVMVESGGAVSGHCGGRIIGRRRRRPAVRVGARRLLLAAAAGLSQRRRQTTVGRRGGQGGRGTGGRGGGRSGRSWGSGRRNGECVTIDRRTVATFARLSGYGTGRKWRSGGESGGGEHQSRDAAGSAAAARLLVVVAAGGAARIESAHHFQVAGRRETGERAGQGRFVVNRTGRAAGQVHCHVPFLLLLLLLLLLEVLICSGGCSGGCCRSGRSGRFGGRVLRRSRRERQQVWTRVRMGGFAARRRRRSGCLLLLLSGLSGHGAGGERRPGRRVVGRMVVVMVGVVVRRRHHRLGVRLRRVWREPRQSRHWHAKVWPAHLAARHPGRWCRHNTSFNIKFQSNIVILYNIIIRFV